MMLYDRLYRNRFPTVNDVLYIKSVCNEAMVYRLRAYVRRKHVE